MAAMLTFRSKRNKERHIWLITRLFITIAFFARCCGTSALPIDQSTVPSMASMNLLLVYKLNQYQVRVALSTTFAQLKVRPRFLTSCNFFRRPSAALRKQATTNNAQKCLWSCRKLQVRRQESRPSTSSCCKCPISSLAALRVAIL